MPKTRLHISIPEPCQEDWAKMIPTQCGAFCQACQKEVVDFSRMSEAEIVDRLSKASGKVCGRIPTTLLDRELVKHEPDHAWYSWKKWAVAAGVMLGVGSAKANNNLYGDTTAKRSADTTLTLPNVNVVERKGLPQGIEVMGGAMYRYESLSIDTVITLSGKVTDGYGAAIDWVTIYLIDYTHSSSIQTDTAGYFKFVIPKELHNRAINFEVHGYGYNDTTFTIIANGAITKDIVLTEHIYTVEELTAVGGITMTPRSRIRNFFRRIGNAFRKLGKRD